MNHLENDVPSFFEHLQNNMPREYAILTAVYHQKLLLKVCQLKNHNSSLDFVKNKELQIIWIINTFWLSH